MTARRAFLITVILGITALLMSGPVEAQLPDPGVPGPFAVTTEDYDFGDKAFRPPDFPARVEMRASVSYPTVLPSSTQLPLIVFIHGIHAPCAVSVSWPCQPRSSAIPSYRGYQYVAEALASHGYIVVSISANGFTLSDGLTSDFGMLGRAELIQAHLNLWNEFNTTGGEPFGTKFVGKVDMKRVGTVGHSVGGEAVVRHFLYNRDLGSPYTIKAVFSIAPTDHGRWLINNVPFAVFAPYCDGDVKELAGVHYYDDSRYNQPGDAAPKHLLMSLGANHNFFNTIWASGDDGNVADPHCMPGSATRLSQAQQRAMGTAYIVAFFRLYVGGESVFAPYLTGKEPPPPSAATSDVLVSYHAPDDPLLRRDVGRFLDSSSLTTNSLGGAVTQAGLAAYGLCGGSSNCLSSEPNFRQPHTAPTPGLANRGLTQLAVAWDNTAATYSHTLPVGEGDVSEFEALQFRAAVNYGDQRNTVGVPQDLTLTLVDGLGRTASVKASQFSRALFYPPGEAGWLPKILLNTVRIPLSAFSGVELTDVRSIKFSFDQSATGSLMIADLTFANPTDPKQIIGDEGDPGAPHLRKASFSEIDELLVIKGEGISGSLALEVNGVVVAPPLVVRPKGSGAKAKVAGTMQALNLRSGSNRIRIKSGSLRSNVVVLEL